LVGGGVAETSLRATARARRLDNVTFVGPQPFDRMASLLALGDAQLISLQDLALFRATLPSKLQATLAAGRPIVGAVSGDAAHVITQAKAVRIAKPGDIGALEDAIVDVADMSRESRESLGSHGRQYYLKQFSQAVNAQRLSDILALARRAT